jgi:hypothetical protein
MGLHDRLTLSINIPCPCRFKLLLSPVRPGCGALSGPLPLRVRAFHLPNGWPFHRQRKPVMVAHLLLACSVDWRPEQSLVSLPLHRAMGHRRQCMSAAIGLAVPHIGMDTVGSIRASGCASSHPKLILRPYQQVRQPCDIDGDAPRLIFGHEICGNTLPGSDSK